jgi:hypothetical protein
MTKDYYTIAEFTELAGMSRQWLYERYWRYNDGPARELILVGKRHHIRINRASADKWLLLHYGKSYRSSHTAQGGTSHDNYA